MLLQGDTRRMATTTDLVPNPKGETPMMMAAYVGWRQTEPDLWLHLIIAHLFGYIILWSGVGAGIYVSYETPFKGLGELIDGQQPRNPYLYAFLTGCRSGALLLFGEKLVLVNDGQTSLCMFSGVLATVSFWLLAISSYFSHHVMLCYQRIFRMNAAVIADRTKHHFKGFDTGRYLTMLKVVTVMTRCACYLSKASLLVGLIDDAFVGWLASLWHSSMQSGSSQHASCSLAGSSVNAGVR